MRLCGAEAVKQQNLRAVMQRSRLLLQGQMATLGEESVGGAAVEVLHLSTGPARRLLWGRHSLRSK